MSNMNDVGSGIALIEMPGVSSRTLSPEELGKKFACHSPPELCVTTVSLRGTPAAKEMSPVTLTPKPAPPRKFPSMKTECPSSPPLTNEIV
jgi:hypothetical protein